MLNFSDADYFGEKSIFEGFQKIIDSIEQVCQVVAAIEFAFVDLSAFIVKFRMKSELVAFPYYDVIFHFHFPFRPVACLFWDGGRLKPSLRSAQNRCFPVRP